MPISGVGKLLLSEVRLGLHALYSVWQKSIPRGFCRFLSIARNFEAKFYTFITCL